MYADTPVARLTRLVPVVYADYLPAVKSRLGIDFDAHNALLEQAVGAAVGQVESFTGHLLTRCQVRTTFGLGLIDHELPYGPVTSLPTLATGDTLTDEEFPTLVSANVAGTLTLEYTAGYESGKVPDALKTAVTMLAADLSGFAAPSAVDWKSLVRAYRRKTWAD